MHAMEFLSADKIAVIDLSSGELSEGELSDDLVQQAIGGAGINAALYEEYKDDDPLILGAGLFTGTLVPGSCLSVLSGKSPLTGELCHAPITQYAGMEFKYSGFDHLVIKGKAEGPVFLWLHDGILDLLDASGFWGQDTWSLTDQVRSDMGDDLIQVLGVGPAAERGSDLAQVVINYWASGDRFGLAQTLAGKNIKAIAIRGMGLLEIAAEEEFVAKCQQLAAEVKAGAWAGKKGLGDLAAGLGETGLEAWLSPLVHRHRADFYTPFAGNTYVMLEGDPAQRAEPTIEEPGVLLTDPDTPLAFMKMGLEAAGACTVIRECARQGLDAAAVASVCAAAGKKDAASIQAELASISGPVEGLSGPFSPWAPDKPVFASFGSGDSDWWRRRQAVAYLFGLSPQFMMMAPEIDEEKLLELAALGTELEFTAEALDQAMARLTG
jgi:aldehyde:ferredoxin oxidoreductase